MTRTMRIRPNRNCPTCHGTGETVTTPRPGGLILPVFCTCVLKQVHGDPGEIELVLNDKPQVGQGQPYTYRSQALSSDEIALGHLDDEGPVVGYDDL